MTILETIPIWIFNKWIILLLAVLCIGSIFLIGYYTLEYESKICLIAFIASITMFIIMLILSLNGKFSYHDHDEYMIAVDDNTSVNELYKKYEILSKEKYAYVYRVKERK